MIQSVRLFWRTARFEILAGLGVSLALTLAMLATANQLDAVRASACAGLRSCDDAAFTDVLITFSEPLRFGASLIPLIIGLLYGPTLVAHELEARSAPFAWALVRSRVRWLVWRAWPALLLVVLLLVGPALAADRLEAASFPQFDPAQNAYDIGSRGDLLVLRGLAAFAIGLAAGVVLGRTLPAILLAGALSIVALGLAASVRPLWLPREVVSLDEVNQETPAVPLAVTLGVVMPDGRLLTNAEAIPLRPPDAKELDSPGYDLWLFHSGARRAYLGISGTHVREVERREGAASGAVAILGFLVALLAIRHRRPQPGLAIELDARRGALVDAGRAPPGDRARWRRSGPWLSWLMTIRVGRPELLGAVTASVVVSGAILAVLRLLAGARIAQGCVGVPCYGDGPFSAVNNPLENWLYPMLAALPFVVGGLLGAPVVARELETGTGRLTWSLTGGRVRWLVWRIVPPLALVVALLVPAAILGNILIHDQYLLDPTYLFGHEDLRGATLVSRGLALFGVGLLAGVVFRRVLPALVVAAIVGVILYNGLDLIDRNSQLGVWWFPPDVIGAPGDSLDGYPPGTDVISDVLEGPDGNFHLAAEFAVANGFPGLTPTGDLIEMDPGFIAWYTARGYRYVTIGWDAHRYPEFVLRESAALVVGAIATICLAGLVLRSRRPG